MKPAQKASPHPSPAPFSLLTAGVLTRLGLALAATALLWLAVFWAIQS
jgi:hypothetical protein